MWRAMFPTSTMFFIFPDMILKWMDGFSWGRLIVLKMVTCAGGIFRVSLLVCSMCSMQSAG